jgi:hypothetical protein
VAAVLIEIANPGTGELVIDQIKTSCACTGLEQLGDGGWARADSVKVPAYGRAELLIRVTVQGRPEGEMRNAIRFRTNAAACPEGRIETVVPRVVGGVTTYPAAASFGVITLGTATRQVLDVYDDCPEPRAVASVTPSDPGRFSARMLPAQADIPAPEGRPGVCIGRLVVTAETSRPGPLDGKIEILLTGGKRVVSSVQVAGSVSPPAVFSPSVVVLPRAGSRGMVYSCECECRSLDGAPLELSLTLPAAVLSVTISPAVGEPGL